MPKNNHKRRTISSVFNLSIFFLLVASFAILLWQLPDNTSSAVQTQTEGQVASVPMDDVSIEEVTPDASPMTVTVVLTLPVPAQLGVVTDEKLAVVLIEPESGAEKAGIQLGDILERIEGIPLILEEDRRKAKLAVAENLEGKEMRLTIIRDGVTLELPFVPIPRFNPVEEVEPRPTITPVWPPYDYF